MQANGVAPRAAMLPCMTPPPVQPSDAQPRDAQPSDSAARPQADLRAEVDYLRKLNLALLTLLEKKGVLSDAEVQTVLRTAHRAAYPPRPPQPVGPAQLGTRWVKAEDSQD